MRPNVFAKCKPSLARRNGYSDYRTTHLSLPRESSALLPFTASGTLGRSTLATKRCGELTRRTRRFPLYAPCQVGPCFARVPRRVRSEERRVVKEGRSRWSPY